MILVNEGHSQFGEWPSLATITQPSYSVNSLLITHSRQNKWITMSATGMTIILIVLVVMAFFVILYMCINCYRGFTHELESKKPPSQRRIKPRNRQTSSSSEQMQKPASLLQVLWLWYMQTYIPKFWMSVNFLRTTHLKNAYSHEQRTQELTNVSSPMFETQASQQ